MHRCSSRHFSITPNSEQHSYKISPPLTYKCQKFSKFAYLHIFSLSYFRSSYRYMSRLQWYIGLREWIPLLKRVSNFTRWLCKHHHHHASAGVWSGECHPVRKWNIRRNIQRNWCKKVWFIVNRWLFTVQSYSRTTSWLHLRKPLRTIHLPASLRYWRTLRRSRTINHGITTLLLQTTGNVSSVKINKTIPCIVTAKNATRYVS